MESELNKLIEQQNQEYEKDFQNDNDDIESSMDIDEFENRLKHEKSIMGMNDDSDEEEKTMGITSVKKTQPTYDSKPSSKSQSRALLSEDNDLIKLVQDMHQSKSKQVQQTSKQIQQQTSTKMTELQKEITKYKEEAKPKTEEEKMQDIFSSNNTSLKDKKLKELIQKNKELYVQYEKEKTMRQKLQKDLEKIKEDTDMQLQAMEGKIIPKSGKQDETDWRKKYNDLEKKLQELKLQNSTMKNDLNKAQRIIAKEIGENINIDQILLQENSWKGRAQQIEVLKARVKELQSKMSSSTNISDMSYASEITQGNSGNPRSSTQSFSTVGGKAKERREEAESMKIQVEALKAENDALNEKVKALSSRKNILEKDVKELKNEIERNKAILLEKSDNDDRYIQALKKELDKSKTQQSGMQTRIVYRDRPVSSKKNEADELDENLARKELSVLRNELEKKEKIIKELINDKVRNVTNTLNKENTIQLQENITDQEKVIKLETMIKILKQENEELSNLKLGIKTTTPDSKIIKDLSLQNAQLRRKLDDLQQKLKS